VADLKPAYLIHGDDETRLDNWRRRLHSRAERERPTASLEVLHGDELTGEALAAAIGTLTLSVGRRYLLADGIERWKDRDVKQVIAALGEMPPETVVVLIATVRETKDKVPAALAKAVETAGGEVHACEAPRASAWPGRAAERARELGFDLDREAAQALVERVGRDDKRRFQQQRLMRELEKLAAYAGPDGAISVEDVDALTVPALEARPYELADAVIEGDSERALRIAEELLARGEPVRYIVYALLRALRQCRDAWALVSAGTSQKEIQAKLGVPGFVARRIVEQARSADQERIERALDELADVDFAIKGGSDYEEGTALTLALARAASVAA
jgi:DNA polymerase-3 subunit delta